MIIALFLIALFLSGFFEAAILGRKDLACSTFLLELLIVVGGVVYPFTTVRIFCGAALFITGTFLLVVYYRKKPTSL